MDYVELVLAVEDKFGIHISDEDAGNVETVGDLYQIVLAKVESKRPGQPQLCLTSAAFYRTRRVNVRQPRCQASVLPAA